MGHYGTEHGFGNDTAGSHRAGRAAAVLCVMLVFAAVPAGAILSGSDWHDLGASAAFYHGMGSGLYLCLADLPHVCGTVRPAVHPGPDVRPAAPGVELGYHLGTIPDVPDRVLVEVGIHRAFDIWEEHNENLSFIETAIRDDADITISYDVITPESHLGMVTTDGTPGGHIDIGLGKHDCNHTYVQHDQDGITDTMMHEIGHILGLDHTSDESHLMYGTDHMGHPEDSGYDIPGQLDGFYVGYETMREQYELLDGMVSGLRDRHDADRERFDILAEIYRAADAEFESKDALRADLLSDLRAFEAGTSDDTYREYELKADRYNRLVVELNGLSEKLSGTAAVLNGLADELDESVDHINSMISRQNTLAERINCYPDVE